MCENDRFLFSGSHNYVVMTNAYHVKRKNGARQWQRKYRGANQTMECLAAGVQGTQPP